jgi:hypothetical protein
MTLSIYSVFPVMLRESGASSSPCLSGATIVALTSRSRGYWIARSGRAMTMMGSKRTANALVGSPIERVEDLRFLRGKGEYVDDVTRPGLLHAVILRSSVAHGRFVAREGCHAYPAKRPPAFERASGLQLAAAESSQHNYSLPSAPIPCGAAKVFGSCGGAVAASLFRMGVDERRRLLSRILRLGTLAGLCPPAT